MEPARSSGAGSGNSGTYTPETAETLRFEEEIQSLMLVHHSLESPPANGGSSSFTALLGLPPSQAVELLHEHDPGDPKADPAAGGGGGGGGWMLKALRVPPSCSPTFPSNAALVERAARLSVFAADDSPPPKPKAEPADSDSPPIFPIPEEAPQRLAKRKEAERSKVRGGPVKKSRSSEEEDTGGDKLPYVHVRARRGQATDSHSLAERARREKINARMKLLQELVPGCSKITGTALVLDEIINHVQSLQRQVEFLSMRLAAVNPRIDFTGLDSFLSAECGRVMACNGRSGMGLEQPLFWSEGSPPAGVGDGGTWQQRQGSVEWERDEKTPHVFVNPSTSLFGYDSAASAATQEVDLVEDHWTATRMATDERLSF